MHFERRAWVLGLAVAAVASACGSESLQNDGHQGSSCLRLDETQCRARRDCAVGTCSICGGTGWFAGCYAPASDQPPACPQLGIPCLVVAPCASLDEASCRARSDCQAFSCSSCGGSYVASCGPAGASTVSCPAVSCPIECTKIADQASCDASGVCHSVFADSGVCDCATPGCCTHYSGCADGARAQCASPVQILCKAATPACEGAYVVSYTSDCYEGCVPATECGP